MQVIRRTGPPSLSPHPDGGGPASPVARDAAIEASRLRAFPLECGHLITYDQVIEDEAFRILETGLGPLWHACSRCFWLGMPYWHKREKQKRKALPPDPLF